MPPPQGEPHPEEPGSDVSTAVDPRHPFVPYLDEARPLHQPTNTASKVGVHDSPYPQGIERHADVPREALRIRMGRIGCPRGAVVRLLDAQPPSTAYGPGHARQRALQLRQMHEEEAAVHQVVVPVLERVVQDIVVTDFDVGPGQVAQEARIAVRGHDLSLRSHLPGEPARDRPVARANLETAPALAHAEPLQTTKGDGVRHLLEQPEDDAAALIGETARRLPPEAARFFCPVRQADFFRRVLKMGCRTIKVWTLMTLGPYEPPREVWMPWVLY